VKSKYGAWQEQLTVASKYFDDLVDDKTAPVQLRELAVEVSCSIARMLLWLLEEQHPELKE